MLSYFHDVIIILGSSCFDMLDMVVALGWIKQSGWWWQVCVVVLKKCCGIFTTLALYNLAILWRFLGVAQFRDSIIVVTLM